MESATTAVTVVGVLVFSFACGVLLEELLLGGLFRLFFAPRPGAGQKRGSERMR